MESGKLYNKGFSDWISKCYERYKSNLKIKGNLRYSIIKCKVWLF